MPLWMTASPAEPPLRSPPSRTMPSNSPYLAADWTEPDGATFERKLSDKQLSHGCIRLTIQALIGHEYGLQLSVGVKEESPPAEVEGTVGPNLHSTVSIR